MAEANKAFAHFAWYINMATITIPKNLIKNDDLSHHSSQRIRRVLSMERKRRNYLKHLYRQSLKRDLERARKNRNQGNFLTIDELKHKLGFTG